MSKYYFKGLPVSAAEMIQHKLKQLKEAESLLEEFSDRCAWADDFADFQSIREALDGVYTAVEYAKEQIEGEILEIEDLFEQFEQKKDEALAEAEEEFKHNISYYL